MAERWLVFVVVLAALGWSFADGFYCSRFVDGQCAEWHLKSVDYRLLEMGR